MATYLIVNFVVIGVMLSVLAQIGALRWNRAMTLTLAVLLVTTAVFDSLIVGSGIVAYDDNLITGVKIGEAPIEDFFYAIAAVILVPNLWNWFEERESWKR